MESKRTCSDFWKNRKNMQNLISQGLAGQINPIFIGYLNCSALPRQSKLYIACSDFFSKIRVRSYRCSSFFVKRHARLSCSVVNALTTARCRYHLFTILCADTLFLGILSKSCMSITPTHLYIPLYAKNTFCVLMGYKFKVIVGDVGFF